MTGVLYVLAFVLLGSALDVYLATYLQHRDPLVTAFKMFIFALLFFQAALGTGFLEAARKARVYWKTFLATGVITTMIWLCFLVALKWIEPVVAGAIAFSIVPAISALLSPILRPKSKASPRETLAAVGIFASLSLMIAGAISGGALALPGVALAILAAAGMSLNGFVVKRLSEAGFKTMQVMAFRFPVPVLVTFVLCIQLDRPVEWTDAQGLLLMSVLSLLAVVAPMFLIQRGIERTEPMVTSILLALTPGATLLFEFLEGRIDPPMFSILGSVLCCTFALYGVRGKPAAKPVDAATA